MPWTPACAIPAATTSARAGVRGDDIRHCLQVGRGAALFRQPFLACTADTQDLIGKLLRRISGGDKPRALFQNRAEDAGEPGGAVAEVALGGEQRLLQDTRADAASTFVLGHLDGDRQPVPGETNAAGRRLVEQRTAVRPK